MIYHSKTEAYQQEIQGPSSAKNVVCAVCDRSFRWESDKKRHKCLDERENNCE